MLAFAVCVAVTVAFGSVCCWRLRLVLWLAEPLLAFAVVTVGGALLLALPLRIAVAVSGAICGAGSVAVTIAVGGGRFGVSVDVAVTVAVARRGWRWRSCLPSRRRSCLPSRCWRLALLLTSQRREGRLLAFAVGAKAGCWRLPSANLLVVLLAEPLLAFEVWRHLRFSVTVGVAVTVAVGGVCRWRSRC